MASIFRPYGGTSRQRLTDLINSTNGTSLIEGLDFEYGSIQEITTHPKYNTSVRLIAKKPGKSDSEITYTRLGIDVLAQLPPEMLGMIIVEALPLSIRESLTEINEALGLDLTEDEVEDLIFYDRRDYYPVQIREGASLAWLPSEFHVRAFHRSTEETRPPYSLSDVWLVVHLDGLHPPLRNT